MCIHGIGIGIAVRFIFTLAATAGKGYCRISSSILSTSDPNNTQNGHSEKKNCEQNEDTPCDVSTDRKNQYQYNSNRGRAFQITRKTAQNFPKGNQK